MSNQPKVLIDNLAVRNLCQTCVEIGKQWYSEKKKQQKFYDLFAEQLGGWPGIHEFKIDLVVELEQEVFDVGGWENITTVYDETIAAIVNETFARMDGYSNVYILLGHMKQFIHEFIEKEISKND